LLSSRRFLLVYVFFALDCSLPKLKNLIPDDLR
jgi:hypothetical protein